MAGVSFSLRSFNTLRMLRFFISGIADEVITSITSVSSPADPVPYQSANSPNHRLLPTGTDLSTTTTASIKIVEPSAALTSSRLYSQRVGISTGVSDTVVAPYLSVPDCSQSTAAW